jgi:hypothetical protein
MWFIIDDVSYLAWSVPKCSIARLYAIAYGRDLDLN